MLDALDALATAADPTHAAPVTAIDGHRMRISATARPMVRCLGQLSVQIGQARVNKWRSGKARALFEYLITHRGHATARDTLIEVLWPDPDAAAAGVSLKVAVHALRQILAELNKSGDGPCLTVEAQDAGYQLIASDAWLDVEEFEECCSIAARLDADDRPTDALKFYEYACELYGGDFLCESFDEWAVFRRESLKDQYLFALARVADAAVESGDYRGCIMRCRELLEIDRYREDTFRTLMICHSRLGQPGRVRRWYELCVQVLRDELDVEPSLETVHAYERAMSRAGSGISV